MEAIHRLSRGDARGLGFTIDDETVGLRHGRDLLRLSVAGSSAVEGSAFGLASAIYSALCACSSRCSSRRRTPSCPPPPPPPPPPRPPPPPPRSPPPPPPG